MSINAYNPQAGATNVANIPSGEGVLDTRKHVVLSFKNMTHSCDIMKNKFEGKIMLTNKRVSLIAAKGSTECKTILFVCVPGTLK